MSKVFISGSIAIKEIPALVEESLNKIIESDMQVLIGDADGIDTKIQNYLYGRKYENVTVYSIYPTPRYKAPTFRKKFIVPKSDSKKERELQMEKDAAMTTDSDYSFIIWDGKSKGSYSNILRAIKLDKKVKIYLAYESRYLDPRKITNSEIEYIYRKNNGYSAAEVVEYLKNEGEEYFAQTRALNKCLVEHKIIKKVDGVYLPTQVYQDLFMIERYRGKVTGIRFKNEFINWVEDWIKKIKPPQEQSLF